MTVWESVVEKILGPVMRTLLARVYGYVRYRLMREFSVEEVAEALERKKLDFDTAFRISGTFSEFVPFVDFATLVQPAVRSDAMGTCRLGDIVKRGRYLGALFPIGAEKASEPAVPIVYSTASKSRKMFSFSTGDQLELKCKLIPLDYGFRGILLKRETYCFEGKPFGLEILDVNRKKLKETNKFIIDSFFLSSLNYEGGIDQFFSSIHEIADILWARKKNPFPITTIALTAYELQRMGYIEASIVKTEHARNIKESTRFDCIEGKLYRFSNPLNIIDKTETQKVLDNMKETIENFSFVHDDDVDEGEVLRALFDLKFTSQERKLLRRSRELESIAKKLYNRPDLREAWDYYLNPCLSVDFQFDQISPLLNQTINPRKMLEERSLV